MRDTPVVDDVIVALLSTMSRRPCATTDPRPTLAASDCEQNYTCHHAFIKTVNTHLGAGHLDGVLDGLQGWQHHHAVNVVSP